MPVKKPLCKGVIHLKPHPRHPGYYTPDKVWDQNQLTQIGWGGAKPIRASEIDDFISLANEVMYEVEVQEPLLLDGVEQPPTPSKRIPVHVIEGKGWWKKHDMKTLKIMASDGLYLPCRFCGSVDCKIAPLKPGAADLAFPFPWTRANAQPTGPRIELTDCEKRAYTESNIQHGIKYAGGVPGVGGVTRERSRDDGQESTSRLSAREIAGRLLEACDPRKARSVARLCSLAGIEPGETVDKVLKFLADSGKVEQVIGGRYLIV